MNTFFAPAPGSSLKRSILETLAYFDVFDYPVRLEDLHRYLHHARVSRTELEHALASTERAGRIEIHDGYYVLTGRRSLIDRFETSDRQNARRLHLALRYGRSLARLPFIRMVATTGSVAMQNGGPDADFDYLLVTQPGRLWLARLFAMLFVRWARLQGVTICPNVILSEDALVWAAHDPYSAHELTQMIPVAGLQIYRRMRRLNGWADTLLPNADGEPALVAPDQSTSRSWQRLVESLLGGPLGTALDRLEMNRKVSQFRNQPGFGVETVFTSDVCQGNFLHHRERTRLALEQRLAALGLTSSVPRPKTFPTFSGTLIASHPGRPSAGLTALAAQSSSERSGFRND